LTTQVISLPIHTEMTDEQQKYIVENFINIVNSLK
jgi:dTDP-4-amino-4,6-dideoxygalactose transaminase